MTTPIVALNRSQPNPHNLLSFEGPPYSHPAKWRLSGVAVDAKDAGI